MKRFKSTGRKVLSAILAAAMVAGMMPQLPAAEVKAADGCLTGVESATAADNIVTVKFNDGIEAKITFLEDDIFRYNVDPSGTFSEYATTVYGNTVKIPQYPDSSENYSHPEATVTEADGYVVITAGNTTIKFEKATAKMTVAYKDNVVMEESKALVLGGATTQSLVKHDGENYYGGGTQNGRFVHTGKTINIANESAWTDGGVASPNPFYYTSEGYGVLRNTFINGKYHFGSTEENVVETVHNENEFDAYYFLSDGADTTEVVQDILKGYYHVTGNPVLLPEYAFYEGHLNAYNRDIWTDVEDGNGWTIYGSNSSDGSEGALTSYRETGKSPTAQEEENRIIHAGDNVETLNGEGPKVATQNFPEGVNTPRAYSARAVLDQYVTMDMPLGYFLPNDGYGAGYGQNGYFVTGGVNADGTSSDDRIAAVDANVANLAEFTEYARENGVETGLWTQSALEPDSNSNTYWHLLRDFNKEVKAGGVTTLKTDVAWVWQGYDMALNSQATAYNTVSSLVNYRPNVISLDGWAGTQRYAGIWTGDQTGGEWEYIRFHIPTYIGQSLSGNPNIGSDMDGIYSGSALISTRDTQWKIFTPLMLNMDGWGAYAKTPHTFGDPYTGINRMYLKMKAQLLPYIYTNAVAAANLETGNDDAGLPMIRAMFLEYPNDAYAATKEMQYQYMFGENVLVAPVYTETAAIDKMGNDVRNGIYLPDEDQIWIDYFTGEQYYGGQTLNNFDAPIWKLPVFVKNGAIIPMWEENNNPGDIDKSNRIAEFWPAGSTEYTLWEDEGTYVENKQTDVDGYGKVNEISYGDHVSTKYTSVVEGSKATLTAEKSTGSYEGYDQNKNTTFVVNVSKEPTKVTAANGATALKMVEKNSKEEVLNAELAAGEFAYYYDAAPAIETYAVEGEDEFAAMMEGKVSSPKLYVKFAETDAKANAQVLTLEGFENADADLPVNELDETLAVPVNLADVAEAKTPTSNTITWDAVEGATSYEVRVNGVINNVGNETSYTHADQAYNSTHTYAVRARGENGYSAWSEEIEATTALDPWRNVPSANITWNGGDDWGALDYATDHNTATMFHSSGDVVSGAEPFIFDLGAAYELDMFEYYARDNYGNGTVSRMDIYTSLDGVHWIKQNDGASNPWTYDQTKTVEENVKVVSLSGAARYVKLIVKESVNNFFAANEIAVYKKDGSNAFAVGSLNKKLEVTADDATTMWNYLGTSEKEGTFVTQIQKVYGDINYNGVYDVYDYAFTMFAQDGGTTKTGKVSGKVDYAVTVEDGKVIIDVVANNVKNLNAFGQVLNYDPEKLSFVSVKAGDMLADMEDLCVNKVYDDGTAYVNLAFANEGDKALVNGTGVLATITLEGTDAKAIDLSSIMVIGPDYSFANLETSTVAPGPITPELTYGEVTNYEYADIANITMTNSVLTEDDGTNVDKLIQYAKDYKDWGYGYASLFNGNKGTSHRDFEFIWDVESNYVDGALPDYVTLPLTLHIEMAEAVKLNEVSVFNANKSNGYMTDAEVVLKYSDGTESEKNRITIGAEEEKQEFAFTWAEAEKTVTEVEITVLSAVNNKNEEITNMLTLAEIELGYNDYAPVTAISAEGNTETLTVGETADIKAAFTPANATNPYFKATSSDASVAEVVVAADENGYAAYQLKAVKAGTATITLTALEDETITAEYTVTVKAAEVPEVEPGTTYGYNDFVITMTNDELTEDDGTNIDKFIQKDYVENPGYHKLFDGVMARDFELLWDWEGNWDANGKLPSYIHMPISFNFELKEATLLDTVKVYNANKANGYMTKAEAVLNYADGTSSDVITVELTDMADYSAFVFEWADVNKAVASVDVTILQTIASDGSASETMMTVAEAEFAYNANVGPAKPEELPLEAIVATTTGNYEVNGGAAEGPAENATDNDESTIWHTDWYPEDGNTYDDHWLQLELDAVYAVSGFKYLPRQGSSYNGDIVGYKIQVSMDGVNWTDATEGTWESGKEWKETTFEAQNAKYVRLQPTETLGDQETKHFSAAAEVRVVGVKTDLEPVVPTVDKTALEAAIAAAEKLNAEDYKDFSAVEELLAYAKNLAATETISQAEVDLAAEELNAAIEALEEKEDEPVDPPVVEEDEVVRLFGESRYDTGYAVADALKEALGVEKFEAVVVATGKNFADALAGSYLAVEKNAPILLTNGKDDNIAELHAYIAANVAEGGKVYILGGEGAVPTAVDAIEDYEVVRLFGDTRYDTNLAILEEAGVAGDSIIVATGKNFADSLSASAAKLPILLVKPEAALNDAQKEVLTGMKNIYIVGGEGAVSAEYEAELAAFGTVTRVFGDSRYDTSVEVAKTFCKDVDFAVVASGKNFPDGLCGGPLAAALNAPLVLTKDGGASAAAAYVAENGIASGFVLGGDGALTNETVVEVFALESADEIK